MAGRTKAASGGSTPSPPKKMNRVIYVRLSEDEYQEALMKASLAGISLAELARRALRRTRTWTLKEKEEVRQLRHQIARIGNNLNQVARRHNSVVILDPADVLKAYRELYQIRLTLQALAEKYLDQEVMR